MDESDDTITRQVRRLCKIIADSADKLRALGEERERRKRPLALDEVYPSPFKTKGGQGRQRKDQEVRHVDSEST